MVLDSLDTSSVGFETYLIGSFVFVLIVLIPTFLSIKESNYYDDHSLLKTVLYLFGGMGIIFCLDEGLLFRLMGLKIILSSYSLRFFLYSTFRNFCIY